MKICVPVGVVLCSRSVALYVLNDYVGNFVGCRLNFLVVCRLFDRLLVTLRVK